MKARKCVECRVRKVMEKTPCFTMGTRHTLLRDAKNLNAGTPNIKPHDIYQQNSTTNKC